MKHLFIVVIVLFSLRGISQDFSTVTYLSNDSVDLQMDVFLPPSANKSNTPLVIFVHGGGFSSGSRTNGHKLARYLQSQNIACASISYTLYMKGKDFGCNGVLSEKIKTIQIVANEIWKATEYFVEHHQEYSINPNKIFLAGSSAGAEAVMQASYWDRTKMNLYSIHLSNDFKYAGVISGAGALMDIDLVTEESKIPLLAFHGDKDNLVPYGTAPHHYCPENKPGYVIFYGSYTIAKKLERLGGQVVLVTYKGGGHQFCRELFYNDLEPIGAFLNRVCTGQSFVDFVVKEVERK